MKKILVLIRNDPNEAMRVAAGLTIFEHEVACVMVNSSLKVESDNDNLELLELSDVSVYTLAGLPQEVPGNNISNKVAGKQIESLADTCAEFPAISQIEFASAVKEVDAVLSF